MSGRDEVRQQPAVVQRRAPAHQLARGRAAARSARPARAAAASAPALIRACGGISKARNSSRPRRPVGAVRRVQLVDRELGAVRVAGEVGQQVAQQPVDQPRRRRLLAGRVLAVHLLERDLELVEAVVARLVDARRLAGRADEHAREQVRQRRVVLPVGDEALQQVGPAQQRAVGGRRAAQRHVVAAAGAGVAAVEHELLGAEPRLPRFLVQRLGGRDQLVPGRRRMDVDLDDAGIGRDVEHAQRADRAAACSPRWRPAWPQRAGGLLDRGQQRDVVLEPGERRHEDVQVAVAHLDAQRGLDHLARRRGVAAGDFLPASASPRASGSGSAPRGANGSTAWLDVGVLRQHVRQRRERQAQPERRIAAERVEPLAPQRPAAAVPLDAAAPSRDRLQRQHEAGGPVEPCRSRRARRARSSGCVRSACERVDVDRQRRLAGEELRRRPRSAVMTNSRGEAERAGEPGRERAAPPSTSGCPRRGCRRSARPRATAARRRSRQ